MRSKIEEYCKNRFDQYLSTNGQIMRIVWEEGEDPPDYYVQIEDQRFAVEVTTIVESVSLGSRTLSDITATASLWRIVEEIEENAKSQGILRGIYTVHFRAHPDNIRKMRPIMVTSILEYVKQTQNMFTAPEAIIEHEDAYICAIEKIEGDADMIAPTGPNGAKWEGEIRSQACALLTECFEKKVYKLRNIIFPKILLLYDAYHFAEPRMYRECLTTIPNISFFHTVFMTNNNEVDNILYTQAI